VSKSEGFVDIAKRRGFTEIAKEKLNQISALLKFQVTIVPACESNIILKKFADKNKNVQKPGAK
jgi:hypothetical protein